MFLTSVRRTSALLVAGASLVAGGVALAGPASAASTTIPLAPGQAACVNQYAAYQVRVDGNATGDGARFKLLRNGVIVDDTHGRVTGWAAERRTSYGNFPGAGTYAACAYNTGTKNTTVYLSILTDGQF